jgi:hypothetical protein
MSLTPVGALLSFIFIVLITVGASWQPLRSTRENTKERIVMRILLSVCRDAI